MSAEIIIVVEAVAGGAAVLLFWTSPWCAASLVALGVSVVAAVIAIR